MLILPISISLISFLFTLFLILKIKKAPSGTGKMVELSLAIREGAKAYLKRQYQAIFLVAIFLFLILVFSLGIKAAVGFLLGGFSSALAGIIGMMVSTRANVKVTQAAKKGLRPALSLAFQGGAVTGFLVVSLGLFSISLFYFLTKDLEALVALGFGASLISIFARLGGGIYTKAADIGGDLVGKIEKEIPEDDPRNPAVIADQVGDNVGDCAGMAADLFETYLVTVVAAMILGVLLFPNLPQIVFLPLILAGLAILASILGSFMIYLKSKTPIGALARGLFFSGILAALGFYFPIKYFALELELSSLRLYFSSLAGILVAGGMFLITDYFTSKKYSPVKEIAKAAKLGPAINIIEGLSIGMRSTILPALLVCAGILVSFWLSGMYGLALATLAMLSLTGLIVALDSYGPITDNAAGIAEMAGLEEKTREVTDNLDAAGNTTKAVTKAYAIASAGLAALVLFSAFTQKLAEYGKKEIFSLAEPKVLVGLFLGVMIGYYFCSLAMRAVGRAGGKIVEEVRRQFKEIKGLMEGRSRPDYERCVDIVTRAALREMILPALLPVILPILVGILLGPKALGGVLIGSIIGGLFLAIAMTSGGAAWDNAKKYIEEGRFGGKGSAAHQAAVIGDTVGDPYKDTAGPAINPMIKVLNIVALLLVGFLV
jgi:K(+)-stimulated pyrophosphate-energized sodium pump